MYAFTSCAHSFARVDYKMLSVERMRELCELIYHYRHCLLRILLYVTKYIL